MRKAEKAFVAAAAVVVLVALAWSYFWPAWTIEITPDSFAVFGG